MPGLTAMLVASILGMIIGGRLVRVWLVTLSAAAFALTLIGVAIAVNLPHWRSQALADPGGEITASALAKNTQLIATAYGWGALAMQLVYTTPLTGLKWQHGWQYALLLLMFALGAFHISQALREPQRSLRQPWLTWAVPMTIATAVMAAGGLVFLVASGKLAVRRADWAANLVFLFGSLMLMVLGAIALKTHDLLTRRS
jgi:hypothetical protein